MTSQISEWELSWIEPVEYLVLVKFPILRPVSFLRRVGDSTFEARQLHAQNSAIKYRKELRALSDEELQDRVKDARKAEFERKKEETKRGDTLRFFVSSADPRPMPSSIIGTM